MLQIDRSNWLPFFSWSLKGIFKGNFKQLLLLHSTFNALELMAHHQIILKNHLNLPSCSTWPPQSPPHNIKQVKGATWSKIFHAPGVSFNTKDDILSNKAMQKPLFSQTNEQKNFFSPFSSSSEKNHLHFHKKISF